MWEYFQFGILVEIGKFNFHFTSGQVETIFVLGLDKSLKSGVAGAPHGVIHVIAGAVDRPIFGVEATLICAVCFGSAVRNTAGEATQQLQLRRWENMLVSEITWKKKYLKSRLSTDLSRQNFRHVHFLFILASPSPLFSRGIFYVESCDEKKRK